MVGCKIETILKYILFIIASIQLKMVYYPLLIIINPKNLINKILIRSIITNRKT